MWSVVNAVYVEIVLAPVIPHRLYEASIMAATGCVVSHSISFRVQLDVLPGTKPGMCLVWGVTTNAAAVATAAFIYCRTRERHDTIQDFRPSTQTHTLQDRCRGTRGMMGKA